MTDARLEVWLADRYVGQFGDGTAQQIYLAELLHDLTYAIEEGCTNPSYG